MVRTVLALMLTALLAGLAGCTAPPPDPGPRRVEPSWGFNGEETRVRVVGTGFYPALALRAAPDGEWPPDGGFSVRLRPAGVPGADATALPGVTHLDLNTVAAVVPPGLTPGAYDVEVRGPAGQLGVGPALFTVRDTRIDGIELSVETVEHEVQRDAGVVVQVVGADGAPVEDDLAVEVLLEPEGDVTRGRLAVEGMEDVEVLDGAWRVRGRVGDDGRALVRARLDQPGEATVRVRAVEPDTRVSDGQVRLAWSAGSALAIEVTLPSWPPGGVRAGDPHLARLRLIDAYGNTVEGPEVPVVLTDACRSWGTGVDLTGVLDVTVSPRTATLPDVADWPCKENRILASGFGLEGASEPFRVIPGPLARFRTTVIAAAPRAGDVVTVVVQPVDVWGNPVAWSGRITTVDDGQGGVGAFSCAAGTAYACEVQVTRAGQVELTVADDAGVIGRTEAFTVDPGAPAILVPTPDTSRWVAGSAVGLVLAVEDAWGNALPSTGLVDTTVVPSDPLDEATCDPGVVGDARIACILRSASPAVPLGLRVTYVDDLGLHQVHGEVAIEVVNGPVSEVRLAPIVTTIRAGQPLQVEVRAHDAWGNPWREKDDGTLRLADTAGALTPVDVVVDGTGVARPLLTLTRSGFTEIRALAGADELGRSEPVLVEAADADRLDVRVGEPWAWVGEPTAVRLEARDAHGNRADLTGMVRVSSASGAAPEVLASMQNGVGEATLTWTSADPSDTVEVASTGLPAVTGRSAPLAVVVPCAPEDAPAADVAFAGLPFARTCLVDGVAEVIADVAGTPAPGRSLALHGLAVGDHVVVQLAPRVRVRVDEAGVYGARVLVAQDDGCATELDTSAWIGPDDGTAVGPLDVRAATASLAVDGSGPDSGIISVLGATTCAGDAAASAPLRVRADRGRVVGAAPTGEGLQVTADATGSASVALDVAQVATGGRAAVSVWSPSGLAWGRAEVDVLGDLQGPEVVGLSPEGELIAPAGQARVTLSEPVDPATVSPASAWIVPEPAAWSVGVDADGRTLVFDFEPPLGPITGGWQLTLEPTVTDLAGNPLAGTWEDVPTAWTGSLGAPGAPPPVNACELERGVFRPDGDDGPGVESDDVRFSFDAAELPVWWVLRVTTRDGALVRAEQRAPTAKADSWRWTGRDQQGRVVPPGVYRLTVDTKGSRGNTGGACSRDVRVDLVQVTP